MRKNKRKKEAACLIQLLLVSKHGLDLLPLILNVLLEGTELLLHDAILPFQPESQLLLKVQLAPIPVSTVKYR